MEYKLFTTEHCPKCPAAKQAVPNAEHIDCGTTDGMEQAMKYQVLTVPTLLVLKDDMVIKRITELELMKNENS